MSKALDAIGDSLARAGSTFNAVDRRAVQARVFPASMRPGSEKLGGKCWGLLEAEVGKLG